VRGSEGLLKGGDETSRRGGKWKTGMKYSGVKLCEVKGREVK